jgi:hypothetical protein
MEKEISTKQFTLFSCLVFAAIVQSTLEPSLIIEGKK